MGSEKRTAPGLRPEPGTPLYVHFPFCAEKCTYCDFYSLPQRGQDLTGALDLLLLEAERRAPARPRTVFLGGGTPSLHSSEELTRFLERLDRICDFRSSAQEVTCECNPESLTPEKAAVLRELGVDRLSIGLQSLEPRILGLFGRVHDVAQGFAAFDAARKAGFTRVSLDLIYGVPGQELARWLADLSRVIALGPDHVSAYQLTYEQGTALTAQLEAGAFERLTEEAELAFFEGTRALLAGAGYAPYEVSNFCLSGQECRHNLNYWRNGPYVGIGPSAVSKLASTRFGNPRSLVPWRAAIAAGSFPAAWEETPPPRVLLGETWWLGLRTSSGVDPDEARQVAGFVGRDPTEPVTRELSDQGFLRWGEGRCRLGERGWPVADAVARRILTACSNPEASG